MCDTLPGEQVSQEKTLGRLLLHQRLGLFGERQHCVVYCGAVKV